MERELVIPAVKKSKMVHTRILNSTTTEVKKIAKQLGVNTNIVINTLLAQGLRGGTVGKTKTSPYKKATKKTAKKK